MRKLLPSFFTLRVLCVFLYLITHSLFALSGSAETSDFIIDVVSPVVQYDSPVSGTYTTGDSIGITWTASDNHPGSNPISLSWRDTQSSPWTSISQGIANSGSYDWTAPSAYTEEARLQVRMTDEFGNTAFDISGFLTLLPGGSEEESADFQMDTVDPTIIIITPEADSIYIALTETDITWSATESNQPDTCIAIQWRGNAESSWQTVVEAIPNANTYSWQIPDTTTFNAQISITLRDSFGNEGSDETGAFTIRQPGADFASDVTSGYVPLTVHFTDISMGDVVAWEWDFNNDGEIDSTEPNPSWTYFFAWDYTVSLTVTFADGTHSSARRESDSETKPNYIHAEIDPNLLITVPGDYSTIQQAIDAASDGDYVIVSDGIYFENLQIVDKEITLASEYFTDSDTIHIDITIIDGSQIRNPDEGSVIAILSQETTNLSPHIVGFTITNGIGWRQEEEIDGQTIVKHNGGGIYIKQQNPWFSMNKVIDNDAEDEGGGSYAFLGNPNHGGFIDQGMENPGGNLFRNNNADVGNDIYIYAPSLRDEVNMKNCHFDVFCEQDTTVTEYWATSNAVLNTEGGSGDRSSIPADLYVSSTGNNFSNDGLSFESPYGTIDYALSLAYGTQENPVTIHIAPGEFSPSLTGESYPLQMVSYVNLQGAGQYQTFLNAEASVTSPDRVVTFDHVEGCRISDLTILGGYASTSKNINGGGIGCTSAHDIELDNLMIGVNEAEGYGAGAYFRNASVVIDSVLFITNGDNAETLQGGGLFATGSDVSILNSIVQDNRAGSGGGISITSGTSTLIDNCEVSQNTTTDYVSRGGGIYLMNSECATIRQVTIQDNSAYYGGGIYLHSIDSLLFVNSRIVNNSATNAGGGMLWNNVGGSILGNLIANNTASSGGGIYGYTTLNLHNNTIANNRGTSYGGGIYVYANSSDVRNCVFWGNYASSGSQAYIYHITAHPTFAYCDLQGGVSSFGFGAGASQYGLTLTENINQGPEFVDPTTSPGDGSTPSYDALSADWSLQETSPCIDQGDPATDIISFPTDIEGNARINNAIIDIGAYEFQIITALDSPANIEIAVTGSSLNISWDMVDHAESYIVKSDNASDGAFDETITGQGVFTQSEGRMIWTTTITRSSKKFYQVVATTDERVTTSRKQVFSTEPETPERRTPTNAYKIEKE